MNRIVSLWFMAFLMIAPEISFAATPPVAEENPTAEFNFIDRRAAYLSASLPPERSLDNANTLPDTCVVPSVPDFFKAWLATKFSSQLSGVTVVLKELKIETMNVPIAINSEDFYNRAITAAPTANPLSLILASLLAGGIENLRGKTIVSVRVSGQIDNQEFSGAAAETFRGRISEDNIKAVLLDAAESTSSEIRAAFVIRAMSGR